MTHGRGCCWITRFIIQPCWRSLTNYSNVKMPLANFPSQGPIHVSLIVSLWKWNSLGKTHHHLQLFQSSVNLLDFPFITSFITGSSQIWICFTVFYFKRRNIFLVYLITLESLKNLISIAWLLMLGFFEKEKSMIHKRPVKIPEIRSANSQQTNQWRNWIADGSKIVKG